ncbi:hypothetical protein FLLO111716_01965 [Flavobacterium longum]|uniref:hypothetical protein n=1 Tax=Flavobacterium longum TaxID=1299340 RepID=UPI0039EA152D
MTKLIFGLLLLLAVAESCPRDKETNDAVLIDEAVVVDSDIETLPDTLVTNYKSASTLGKINELTQLLKERIENGYPGDGVVLYEFFRKEHGKLLEQLNQESVDLFDKRSLTYDEKRDRYNLSDSLAAAIKTIEDAGLKVYDAEEFTFISPTPYFFYDLFKDAELPEEYKAFLKLEAIREDENFNKMSVSQMHAEMGKQLMGWEDFLVRYRDGGFVYEDAKKFYRITVMEFLFGTEYEGSTDAEGEIRPEFKKGFDALVKKYPKSVSAKLVTAFVHKNSNGENGNIWHAMEKERDQYFNREP